MPGKHKSLTASESAVQCAAARDSTRQPRRTAKAWWVGVEATHLVRQQGQLAAPSRVVVVQHPGLAAACGVAQLAEARGGLAGHRGGQRGRQGDGGHRDAGPRAARGLVVVGGEGGREAGGEKCPGGGD